MEIKSSRCHKVVLAAASDLINDVLHVKDQDHKIITKLTLPQAIPTGWLLTDANKDQLLMILNYIYSN